MKLSENFSLHEFLPDGYHGGQVPHPIVANLTLLATTILQPARTALGVPFNIHSGWRPEKHNLAVGGTPSSDHPAGRAADFHVYPVTDRTWEENTFAAHEWIRKNLDGHFGQLILEDHRAHYGNPRKLWIHVSLPSEKHPGNVDPNRLLVSHAPREYAPWIEERFA